jgi:hypothetical protein
MNKKIKFRFGNTKEKDCPYENRNLKSRLSRKISKVNEQPFCVSDIEKLEIDMQRVARIIDNKIVESEEKALAFLSNNPERIPWYISRLNEKFEDWNNESI